MTSKKVAKKSVQKVWTIGCRPFVMGGDVYYPLMCELECDGPYAIGKGYSAYTVTSPKGRVYVAEATTGAFVGNGQTVEAALDAVRRDVAAGSKAVMAKQVADAAKRVQDAESVTAAKFWSLLDTA